MPVKDDGYEHLGPLVKALIAAGNDLVYEGGLFQLSQGGPYCALARPINFEIARAVPSRTDVEFYEALDMITCRHCWAVIYGGRHMTAQNQAWQFRLPGRRHERALLPR